MRQTLGTKISGATARYYLPFRLPSDIYFSDIFVKTVYDLSGVDVAYATYIRVLVYENESDYVEVAGVPAGNPLVLFEGWVRNNTEGDHVRIPINYIADLNNYSRYYITADYVNTYDGVLSIDVLYSDVVSPSTAIYDPRDHYGMLQYTVTLTSTAATNLGMSFVTQQGEWFELRSMFLRPGTGVANKDVSYNVGVLQNREIIRTVSAGDDIFLDRRFVGHRTIGLLDYFYINGAGFTIGHTLTVRVTGFVRTANLPTFTLTGSCTKSGEGIVVY